MIPTVCFVGQSGVGKTTLLERVTKSLKQRGFRVAAVKHAHHNIEIDQPGKDSWRLAEAGSETVVVSSPNRLAMIRQVAAEPTLDELAPLLEDTADIIIVEGYGRSNKPTIEVARSAMDAPLRYPPEELLAVVSDEELDLGIPTFDSKDVEPLVDFIIEHEGVTKRGNGLEKK